ncbi:unnamed protein product [Eretmochelys imbricata]
MPVPIYKKENEDNLGNYKPVSLTSVPGKIMEQIIKQSICKHLEDNKVISNIQHGFVKTNRTAFFDRRSPCAAPEAAAAPKPVGDPGCPPAKPPPDQSNCRTTSAPPLTYPPYGLDVGCLLGAGLDGPPAPELRFPPFLPCPPPRLYAPPGPPAGYLEAGSKGLF